MVILKKGDTVLSPPGTGFWHEGCSGVVLESAPHYVCVEFDISALRKRPGQLYMGHDGPYGDRRKGCWNFSHYKGSSHLHFDDNVHLLMVGHGPW